jgi:hypothetical protein
MLCAATFFLTLRHVTFMLCALRYVATSHYSIHCKKRLAIFPSPAGMSQTKLSLAWNNKVFPGQGDFGV